MNITRADCAARDQADGLAFTRARFTLPEGVIYLDGNSLGALPVATIARLAGAVQREWGAGLIRSWNAAGWVSLPNQIGGKIAALLGARDTEVVAADSTSINLFKLLAGALQLAAGTDGPRRVILSEAGNFPTDLYMAQGLNTLLGGRYRLKLVEPDAIAATLIDDVAVALLTQVDYRTGRLHDMSRLNAVARKNGTRIIWDLSHSAGALPISLNASGSELAVGCGYKYLNGGPGAPAYLYVAEHLHAQFPTPLSGWFGHRAPFDFAPDYVPAAGIDRFQCGTPSVLAMQALDAGLDTLAGVDMTDLRTKSLALSDLFWRLMDQHCAGHGFQCVSPRDPLVRGSHLAFAHEHAYAVMQALIDRGVIGDVRQPSLLRFGFTPLYLRYTDIWDAVMTLRDVMQSGAWKADRHQHRHTVT